MTQTHKALLLGAAMIAIALLAVFDIVPEEVAQYTPLAMIILFPSVILGKQRCPRPAA